VRQTAHSLKGSLGYIGFIDAADLALEVEKASRAEDAAGAAGLAAALMTEIEAAQKTMVATGGRNHGLLPGKKPVLPAPDDAGDVATAGDRVLVAEDDPVYRVALQHFLRGNGYQVQLVSDGLQALQEARSPQAPRLLLLDWMMPGLQGPKCAASSANFPPSAISMCCC